MNRKIKRTVAIVGCIVIVLTIGCFLIIQTTLRNIETTHLDNTDLKGIVPIEYADLKKMEETTESFLLYIGRADCKDCKEFNIELEAELNGLEYTIYYLDLNKVRKGAGNEAREDVIERYEIDWVPTILHINEGDIVSRYQHFSEKTNQENSEVNAWLEQELNSY